MTHGKMDREEIEMAISSMVCKEAPRVEYTRKYQGVPGRQYDEVKGFIGRWSSEREGTVKAQADANYFYYFFDEERTQVIRTHFSSGTIELSSRVDPEIAKAIHNIIGGTN